MKIYFAGAIRGGREDISIYIQIVNHLKNYGPVLTEHVADKQISAFGEVKLPASEIYARDINWISQADVVIAEVSTPSLGVGYELMNAVSLGKKILCLYRPQEGKRLSAMIAGCPQIVTKDYVDLDSAKGFIDEFLNNLKI